jgi:cytochrome c553
MKRFFSKTLRPLAALAILFASSCEKKSSVVSNDAEAGAAEKNPTTAAALPDKISFNEHVQPILAEYCYHCHGADGSHRKPEKEHLRLDMEEHAFAMRDSGAPVIIKGKPAESELIRLIKSKDIAEVMPPPESHKTMSERQIALLEKWIEQGAEYEGHWSYEPVVRAEAPKNEWSDKPIDGFVFEKLAAAGLEPNADENPRRFHRRLSLDLSGLPPEPAETDAFEAAYAKDAEAAIAAEADRLLGSIQSAEHFARHWLDAARYADTHGIHIDNYRAIWPYRDWVVRAFHQNMKWDQFTIEQLAGDLLPDRSLDQHVATGFLRSLATTGEGGAIPEEYESIYANDRVDTMGGIWLGMTASCASCHDHKFDPLSTKEFYELTAFFRNNTMSALDGNNAQHAPAIFVPLEADREKMAQIKSTMMDVDARIAARREAANGDYQTWLATAGQTATQETDSTLSIHLPLTEAEGPIKGTVNGQPQEWPTTAARIDGPLGKALTVSGSDIPLGDIGGFSRGDQVSYGGFIRIDGDLSKVTGALIAKMDVQNHYRGWDLYIEQGRPGAHVIDTWDKSATKVTSGEALKSGTWHHVMILFDGTTSGHQAMSIFVDGKRVQSGANPNTVGGTIENTVPLRLGAREAGDSKIGGQVSLQDFRFYRKLLSEAEISHIANRKMMGIWAALPADQRTPEQNKALFEHYITTVDAPTLALLREKDALKSEEAAITARGSASLVYEEKQGQEPFAHVLTRGAYADKGEKVSPNTPAYLPPMPEGAPKNRLSLAKWLNDPKNPLPARVTMNRLWYYLFGAGIVESNGDFGIMGARPTHPKLLDWLASEFVASGWDHRQMVKTIVTSRAYRQSGSVSPEKLEKDPSNALISRGPRTRLEGEQLRDLSLAASGLLSASVGGPPVKPYQPEGIWEAVAMPQSNTKDYKRDNGAALYRRSLYTFWKRTAAPPTMEILDAPSREKFCVKRDRTNTPLQALALMNDPQFVEAGKMLAAKALSTHQAFDERLDLMTLRLIGRKMETDERGMVKTTLDAATAYYTGKPEEARLALTVGETKTPETIPAVELAAWALVAGQLMNLDETLTR